MKNSTRLILVISLVFLLILSTVDASSAQSKDYKALLGSWDVEPVAPAIQMEFVFTIDEDTLYGELRTEMGSGVMEEITFEDNKLTFLVSVDAGGQVFNLKVLAKVDDDEMTGTMYSDMGESGFSGKKRKDNKT
ncbi:MAG: hypothetical protein GQ544_05865 [Candidatus Aminicenantes bacterium]|nr:hypothetical protein [Candidatus Aminicenantes bacterium]